MIGKTVSHYKILEKLGEGGMGVVYKAHDTKLDRDVALKFLPTHLTANETEKKRFLHEAKAAAQLNHTNVCSIYEIYDEGEQPFIVMEYVEGKNLRQLTISTDQLPTNQVINFAIEIAEALQEAHSKGIIHRDIKSENIMVNNKNQIKVMDFGLAKIKGVTRLTKTTSTAGTIAYMSPEQLQGGEIDARSDIFSFGVVLYEMLSGQLPFKGDYESSMMYSIANEEPEPILQYRSDLSSEWLHIINRIMEKNPADRYQTINDILIDLRRIKRELDKLSIKRSIPQKFNREYKTSKNSPKSFIRKKILKFVFPVIILLIVFISTIVLFKPLFESNSKSLNIIPIPFTSEPGWEIEPALSPDGAEIAFSWMNTISDNSDIYVKVIGTNELDPLTTHPGSERCPIWSPDKKYIAFGRLFEDKASIIRISSRGGSEQNLLTISADQANFGISWSPDGEHIAYSKRESHDEPFSIYLLKLINLSSRKLTQPKKT
jgi:serine/threonine protein kinase